MATANDLTRLAASLAQLAESLASHEPEPEPAPLRRAPERVPPTVEEAARYLSVGHTLMYRLIKYREIETDQIHRLRRVPRHAKDASADRICPEQNAAY